MLDIKKQLKNIHKEHIEFFELFEDRFIKYNLVFWFSLLGFIIPGNIYNLFTPTFIIPCWLHKISIATGIITFIYCSYTARKAGINLKTKNHQNNF